MLPALPTGRQWMSGASPSASTISNDAVFCPCNRKMLTELTSDTGKSWDSFEASARQSSKLPLTCSSLAPCTSACASLPSAILPCGTSTAQVSPARAAYAAAEALVLPVEAQMIAFDPSSTALDTAIVMPRSLKDPVGLAPSTLRWTSAPVRSESTGAGTSGVLPSCRVTTGVASVTGRRSRYASISPRHMVVPSEVRATRKNVSHRPVRDRLDVVTVRITDERAVVVLVVLGVDGRLVQHLAAGRDRGGEERVDGRPVGRGERQVGLAETLTGVEHADPEIRLLRAVPERDLDVHQPPEAQRRQHGV